MNIDIFTPQHLKTTILDLLKDDKRDLAWQLIDHYYAKAHTLEHFDVLGYVSLKAEKRDSYLKCAEAAYAIATTPEQKYAARSNLYRAYNAMNMPEKALFYIEHNLNMFPDDFETQCHRAFNISLMGDKQTAEEMLIGLAVKYPDQAHKLEAAFAGKHLREGRTATGMLSFLEPIKPTSQLFEKTLNMKPWNGVVSAGKTVYIEVAGGIGDQIINLRFLDILTSYGMNPILISQNTNYYTDINSVFRRHGYQVITDTFLIDRTQSWVSMMSLPGYLGLTE